MNKPGRLLVAATVAALLGACAMAPDKLPPPKLRDSAPLAGLPDRARADWPDPRWWRRYDDPQLDRLIDDAVNGSTSLATARARVADADAAARVTAAQVGLRVDGNIKVSRQRMSENGLIPPRFLGFTWYTQADLGVQASYDFDFWGKNRAAVESAIGQVHAAEAERSAAALALQAQIAQTYFGWLADHARLRIARHSEAVQAKLLHIEQVRASAGLEPSDAVLQGKDRLAAARQQIAALRGSAAVRKAVLAALVGVAPAKLDNLKPVSLPHARPWRDAALPAGAGLDLVARRPDVAARRWQVEAALRGTDAARAQFFPDLSLTAMAGLSSIDMGSLLNASSRTFALTPALHLPIFEGGLLRARYGQSKAQLDAAVAQYDDAVVQAAREVAGAVLNLQALRAQHAQEVERGHAMARLQAHADARRRQGLTDARPALQAALQHLAQRDDNLALDARMASADVALMKALGGGYRMPGSPDAAAAAPASTSSSARTPTP